MTLAATVHCSPKVLSRWWSLTAPPFCHLSVPRACPSFSFFPSPAFVTTYILIPCCEWWCSSRGALVKPPGISVHSTDIYSTIFSFLHSVAVNKPSVPMELPVPWNDQDSRMEFLASFCPVDCIVSLSPLPPRYSSRNIINLTALYMYTWIPVFIYVQLENASFRRYEVQRTHQRKAIPNLIAQRWF